MRTGTREGRPSPSPATVDASCSVLVPIKAAKTFQPAVRRAGRDFPGKEKVERSEYDVRARGARGRHTSPLLWLLRFSHARASDFYQAHLVDAALRDHQLAVRSAL